jgi:hypothetical protein
MTLWLELLNLASYRTENQEKEQHVPTSIDFVQDLYLNLSSFIVLLMLLIDSLLILAAALIYVLDVS